MARHIIAFTDRPATVDFVTAVANRCSAELEVFTSIELAVNAAVLKPNLTAIFIDVSSSEQVRSFEALAAGRIDKNRTHMMVFPQDIILNEKLLENSSVGHLIFKKLNGAREDGEHYARIVEMIDRGSPFGLKSLIHSDIELQVFNLSGSEQKGRAVNAIALQLQKQGSNERVALAVAGAVDELLMNAMFDAPIDENGEQKYAREPRSNKIEETNVEMQFGVESDLIAVQVSDLAGSLNRSTVMSHIAKSFHGRQELVRDPELAGAGLGLVLILKSGGSLCFVSEPGKRTEVTVFFHKMGGLREIKNQLQFVSTFVLDESAESSVETSTGPEDKST